MAVRRVDGVDDARAPSLWTAATSNRCSKPARHAGATPTVPVALVSAEHGASGSAARAGSSRSACTARAHRDRVIAVLQRLVDGPAVERGERRGRAPRSGRTPVPRASSIRRQNSVNRTGRACHTGPAGRPVGVRPPAMSHGRVRMARVDEVLERFSAATRAWFAGAFAAPTPAQVGAWEAVSAGRHALVVAPTGSGKTLAAFLWALDRLATEPAAGRAEAALPRAVRLAAQGARRRRRAQPAQPRWPASGRRPRGSACRSPTITVGVRSGDTPADERRRVRDQARPTSSSPRPSRCSWC